MKFLNVVVAVALVLFPLLVMADLLPSPLPSQMPLHRIGYEIVFEVLVASAAGAAAVRALVRNRWKFGDETTSDERSESDRKIESVMPRLRELMGRANMRDEYGGYSLSSVSNYARQLEWILCECADLREALKGVPIEWVYEALDHDAWDACADTHTLPWSTNEDELLLDNKVREEVIKSRRRSPSTDLSEISKAILEAKRKEQTRRRRMAVFIVTLIVVVIVAWLIGYYA